MSSIYVVTQGSYSDYRIVAAFSDEKVAGGVRDLINAGNSYAEADVEEYPIHGPDFKPGKWLGRSSSVSQLSGDVVKTSDCVMDDIPGTHSGKSQTRVSEPRMALEHYEVYTHGDAERVPQAHADAVAKLRAEVLGL